jgi:hypothetical protein
MGLPGVSGKAEMHMHTYKHKHNLYCVHLIAAFNNTTLLCCPKFRSIENESKYREVQKMYSLFDSIFGTK